jgi:AcrR family transcriptional regulator
MPKVLPEYLELRRQQILDSAAVCFSRRGFHQTTMQDICREVELSPGAVYRYFPSKEAIIEGMCNRGLEQNAEALEQSLASGGTLAAFEVLIRVFFEELDDLRSFEVCSLNVELIAESPRNERVQAMQARNIQDVRSRLVGFIRVAQARGDIDPSLDPDAIARVMIAMYQGLITQRLVEPDLDVASYADVLRSLFGGAFWRGGDTEKGTQPASPAVAGSALHH